MSIFGFCCRNVSDRPQQAFIVAPIHQTHPPDLAHAVHLPTVLPYTPAQRPQRLSAVVIRRHYAWIDAPSCIASPPNSRPSRKSIRSPITASSTRPDASAPIEPTTLFWRIIYIYYNANLSIFGAPRITKALQPPDIRHAETRKARSFYFLAFNAIKLPQNNP